MNAPHTDRQQEIALFRYGVIAELVQWPKETKGLYEAIEAKAEREYSIPGSTRTRIAAETIRDWLKALDVFPVHGVGGMLGTFLVGIFAYTLGGNGSLKPGQSVSDAIINQVGVQLTGIVVHIVWAAVMTYLVIKLVDVLVGVRVSSEEETEGLDYTLHGEVGYHDL